MHPHKDMEIISYVVEGSLSHKDSMGNEHTIDRGHVQYMSAGTGVFHSEHNWSTKPMRLIQMWILPNKKGLTPSYGDYRFEFDDRISTWMPIATSTDNAKSSAPIKIHADVNVYASFIAAGESIDFKVGPGRQAYLVQLEGKSTVNNVELSERDALEIIEEDISITASTESHFYIIEMQRS
jgi:redox-sensitive bicupin YhaK (pirin superfamily)